MLFFSQTHFFDRLRWTGLKIHRRIQCHLENKVLFLRLLWIKKKYDVGIKNCLVLSVSTKFLVIFNSFAFTSNLKKTKKMKKKTLLNWLRKIFSKVRTKYFNIMREKPCFLGNIEFYGQTNKMAWKTKPVKIVSVLQSFSPQTNKMKRRIFCKINTNHAKQNPS